jgi:hypothetical protein
MKILLSLSVVLSLAFGFEAEVKKADVELLVNKQNSRHKVGDKVALNSGDVICLIGGEGRVVISGKDYKKQISKKGQLCRHLPSGDKNNQNFADSIKGSVLSLFGKSKEQSKAGVSRKAVTVSSYKKDIILTNKDTFLAIENDSWTLPVTLTLQDNNKTIKTLTNEKDFDTSFILPKSILKNGYKVVVKDGLDEVVVDSKIIIK